MAFEHGGKHPPSLSPSYESDSSARRSTMNFSRPLPPKTLAEVFPQAANRGSSGERLITHCHDAQYLHPPGFTRRPRSPIDTHMPSPLQAIGLRSGVPASPTARHFDYRRDTPSRLSIPRTRPGPRPNSFISMTPVDLPGISHYQPMSYGQLKEISRVAADRDGKNKLPPLSEIQGEFSAEPPDGGFLAWAHAVCGFFVCFNTLGLNMTFGVFQAYYTRELLRTCSRSKIAWIGSFQLFSTFVLFLLVGFLTSKGYFKLCFRGGAAGVSISLLLISFCKEFWQFFLVQGVLMGCSMGFLFTATVTVTTTYFSTNLGVATALAAVGTSFGGVIFPLIFNHAIHKLGFGWTIRLILLINIITMIPPLLVIRERPEVPLRSAGKMDWTMFKDIPYLIMAAGMFFAFWGMNFGFYFIALFGQEILHMPPQQSFNLLIGMNACNMMGRLVPALISDACLGPLNTLIPSVFISAGFVFFWTGIDNATSMFLMGCFYGFSAAAIQSLYLPTVFSFLGGCRSNSPARVGLVFILMAASTLTGAPIGGQLIAVNKGSYLYAQLFAGFSLLLGGLLFLTARFLKHGWSPDKL